ncbi:glycosyltransferase family 2 protein [Palleronia sp.]|uniref:glycosyltransferase family 2 protein n=1 Tax=Palleronia sp. TaxID=1940284 RepID=UPI0035C7BCDF
MPQPDVTVIVVSYNTRALTLACLRTLHETTETPFHAIVVDNASRDGSAEAIATAFPKVELIALEGNIGFAAANNLAAERAQGGWLLLLNPDTECHAGAVDRLLAFSQAHPDAGITGGRTVFPDGSLNIASCWQRNTLWSTFCRASGLAAAFPRSDLLNPEAMGGWQRDSEREVDIVVGCFLMIRRSLWDRLGGFDRRYFMYGEEADLCLRARALGYRPRITPEAQIMHMIGAAADARVGKYVQSARARATLMADHWPAWQVPLGRALLWLWVGGRAAGFAFLSRIDARQRARAALWSEMWSRRSEWLGGYG